jgi:hypothetical protein
MIRIRGGNALNNGERVNKEFHIKRNEAVSKKADFYDNRVMMSNSEEFNSDKKYFLHS